MSSEIVVSDLKPQKSRKTGRMEDVKIELTLSANEQKEPCDSNRLKCFETISELQRSAILLEFNSGNDL